MDAVVQRIAGLVGWSDPGGAVPNSSADDLRAAESAIGVVLPEGYRELVLTFPPGEFNSALQLIRPYPGQPAELYRSTIGDLCDVFRMMNEFVEPRRPIFPEEGGLLPWATVDGAFYVCWLYSSAADAATWPCVVCSTELDIYYPTNRDTQRTFLGLIKGEIPLGSGRLINDETPTPRFDLEPVENYPRLE